MSSSEAKPRRRWLDPLKIVVFSLAAGPPIGGIVAIFGLMLEKAVENFPPQFIGWWAPLFLLFELAQALLFGVLLAIPSAAVAYMLGWLASLVAGVLFVGADLFAPFGWSRPRLGALCGVIPSSVLYIRDFAAMPREDFITNETLIILAGGVSGWVCAWACRRAGWTR